MVMHSLSEISNKWQPLTPFLSAPHTEAEYDNLSAFLDQLIDEVGNDESHPLAALMDTVGTLIEAYDKEQRLIKAREREKLEEQEKKLDEGRRVAAAKKEFGEAVI